MPDQAWERSRRCPPNRRRSLPSVSRSCSATLRVTAAVADRRDRGCGRLSTRPPRRGRSSAPPPDGSLTVGVVGSKLGLAVSVSGQARAQERRRKSPPTRRRFFPPVILRPPVSAAARGDGEKPRKSIPLRCRNSSERSGVGSTTLAALHLPTRRLVLALRSRGRGTWAIDRRPQISRPRICLHFGGSGWCRRRTRF